jgi:hypothetical protein
MIEDKYIGLGLAISSSLAIGNTPRMTRNLPLDRAHQVSRNEFCHNQEGTQRHTHLCSSAFLMWKGLIDASERHGFSGDNYGYMQNPIWWAGMITSITFLACSVLTV